MGVTYIPIARVGEIADGEMKAADLSGRSVVLANVGGEYRLFARECPHEGADLLEGDLIKASVRCDNHSYTYDLETGQCLVPEGGPPLAVFPIEQRGGEICVKLEW